MHESAVECLMLATDGEEIATKASSLLESGAVA